MRWWATGPTDTPAWPAIPETPNPTRHSWRKPHPPTARVAIHADRQQQDRHELHKHVGHLQAHDVREQCDPLVRQWRIGGLRKSAKPFFVPRIEPMMRVVRREKNVRVRIVRTGRQLHQQQGTMHRQSDQQDAGTVDRSRRQSGRLRNQWTASGGSSFQRYFDSEIGVRVCCRCAMSSAGFLM